MIRHLRVMPRLAGGKFLPSVTLTGMARRLRRLGLVAGVWLALVPAPGTAAPAPAPDDVTAALDLSGVSDILQQIPDDISGAIDDGDLFNSGELSPDDTDVIKQVLAGAFDPDRLQRDLAGEFRGPEDAPHIAAVLRQLRTPLARRISALERSANDPDSQSDYDDFVAGLALHAPDPQRVALMRRLDRVTHSTEVTVLVQIEIAKTVAQAVAVFDPRRRPLSTGEMERLVLELKRRITPTVHNRIVVWSLYAYRGLDDRDLQAYIDLYADKDMQWFLQHASEGLIRAMGAAADRAGRGITTLRNAQQI